MDPPENPAKLTEGERALVRVSAVLATGNPERIRAVLEEARTEAPRSEIEEVLLQSHLFLGYPATLGALGLWREVSGPSPDPGEAARAPSSEEVRRRGEQLCRRIYGSAYEGLRSNVRALHPALDRWMIEDGYGKVLGRPELDAFRRELAIVGLLAVLGASAQLHSHLRGSVRMGASPAQVEETLAVAREFMEVEAIRASEATWSRVRERL